MIFNLVFSKINSGIIKIPTLIGLGVLLLGLAGGVFLITQNQTLRAKAEVNSTPKDITVFNLSATSAAVFWQTDEDTTGFIQAWVSPQTKSTYRDDRDLNTPLPHKLHFVTLTNLNPDTTYYYQIYSGPITYPNTPAIFTTLSPVQALSWNPIVGTILNSSNQPAGESLIILEMDNAQKLAAITKTGGNFILPLSNLRTSDLTKSFPENNNPHKSKLKITGPSGTSEITLLVPTEDLSIPPIFLGKNVDLTQNPSDLKPSSTISAENQKFDLNKDGTVDATDLSIILKNFGPLKNASGSNTEKQKSDLNGDKAVDQKDVDLILPYLK